MLKSLAKSIFPAAWLSYCKRRVNWLFNYVSSPGDSFLHFRCNICGKYTSFPRKRMMRENPSCVPCGSTVRLRSIIEALSIELFQKSLAIQDFPERHDLVGVGMSDWSGYADKLAVKLGYTNTYYHKEPFLDIASSDPTPTAKYDFIIASEVFEHVSQPVSRAFENALHLLKPGGVFIFSTPVIDGKTREHFPDLHKYALSEQNNHWILENLTADGQTQRYENLTFHGGPGTTLEMRVFGKDSLKENFAASGFKRVRMHGEEVEEFGIVWNAYVPEEAPYRPLIYGLDAPPWSARREP